MVTKPREQPQEMVQGEEWEGGHRLTLGDRGQRNQARDETHLPRTINSSFIVPVSVY